MGEKEKKSKKYKKKSKKGKKGDKDGAPRPQIRYIVCKMNDTFSSSILG
jgi:hypothetical protein